MSQWIEPRHSRAEVIEAGRLIASSPSDDADRPAALEVAGNWRSSHVGPLSALRVDFDRLALAVDSKVILAQRLKRLESITTKLQRIARLTLPDIQDIAGCRAILWKATLVGSLASACRAHWRDGTNREFRIVPELEKDYIARPKSDGYRSYHVICEYHSAEPNFSCFDGHRIEIQLRTRLQHAWATAVETVDTFTGQKLKTGKKQPSKRGEVSWSRFFALMSSAIALREGGPVVPGTPQTLPELAAELHALDGQFDIEATLSGFATVTSLGTQPQNDGDPLPHSYLLTLDRTDVYRPHVRVSVYPERMIAEANAAYLAEEKVAASRSRIQTVLVSVANVDALKTAYPNYYGDLATFVGILRETY